MHVRGRPPRRPARTAPAPPRGAAAAPPSAAPRPTRAHARPPRRARPRQAQAGAAGAGALSKSIEKISSKSAVKVAVVVRPLLPFELQAGAKEVVAVAAPSKVRHARPHR